MALKHNGDLDKDHCYTCTECGSIVGDGVETCPICSRRQAEEEGHYGYTDVWGNWICYNSCPACEAEYMAYLKNND